MIASNVHDFGLEIIRKIYSYILGPVQKVPTASFRPKKSFLTYLQENSAPAPHSPYHGSRLS